MPRRTMHAEDTPMRVVIVTLDGHLGNTAERVVRQLRPAIPGLVLDMHPASDWGDDETALARCRADIARADIIVCTMLFLEPHIDKVLPALAARAPHCDAFVGAMSGAEIVKLTRLGKLTMGGELKGPMAILKKLRGSRKSGQSSGAAQMKTLRRLPKILKYIPGTAQDLRVYFIVLQCWLAGSEDNIACLVRTLVQRYAAGERAGLRERLEARDPVEYPETGLYHPRMRATRNGQVSDSLDDLPAPPSAHAGRGTVGLLMLRSYLLADNRRHYDRVIETLEARGLTVIPAFASGLDGRPAIDAYFRDGERTRIDCLLSLTGFSLVGGPAYNDSRAAVEALERIDVPYLCAHPSEFQSLDQWADSSRGLTPIETTMMVALPELDGATGPIVYAGQKDMGSKGDQDKFPIEERVGRLADRVVRLVALRRKPRRERRLGIVLFNFPPNAGAVGTAAHLAVFDSLLNTLRRLADEGYDVEVPDSVDTLRAMILGGNASVFGTDANVLATVPTDDHVRDTPWLEEIEAQWGAAPGKLLTDGRGLFVLGVQLGKVTIGLQPGFGYEGDPMRLLFEGGFAPTHAFSAFYRYLHHTVGIDAQLHFGTHGALEFMPGKQSGLSGDCWPERLVGDVPNFYFYAANNPSEASIAKRRSAATLVSYLTPAVTEAGLYKGLADVKSALLQWKSLASDVHDTDEAEELLALIGRECAELELEPEGGLDFSPAAVETTVRRLGELLVEYEHELIPSGLHVIGEPPSLEERVDVLHAFQSASRESAGSRDDAPDDVPGDGGIDARGPSREEVRALIADADGRAASETAPANAGWRGELLAMNRHLLADGELAGMVHALDGGYVPAAPAGDLLRNAEALPTGRNIHGFDPFRMPTAFAQRQGERVAELLIERHRADSGDWPRSIAFVLWGSDNLKNEGVPIAQVLALMGARPRFDAYGKIVGATLVPLAELGRPRIDVLTTLSGVFRDLLPLQTRMLAEAALLASSAEEPPEMNYVRAHTLAHQAAHGGDFETAALRVFSNADGAYGANVNLLIDSGAWEDEGELADAYANRKCYAFGTDGVPVRSPAMLQAALADVDVAYQNLESVELGVTQLDYYFDTLGGINSMVKKARGSAVPTYIGDQTQGSGTVRSLKEQVALETRTRMLNPTWYEGQLKHGYEGVRTIETSITNTLGWSATTGQISPWVYNQMAQTFVLDRTMRERLATLNPTASARMANRLIEASERNYWSPSDDVLQALQEAGDELEDRLEGVIPQGALA